MVTIEKSNAVQHWQNGLWDLLPSDATIVGANDDPARCSRVRSALTADRPTAMGINEEDRVECARSRRRFLPPGHTSIIRMPDHTTVAHCPTGRRANKRDVVERGVVAEATSNWAGLTSGRRGSGRSCRLGHRRTW